MRVQFELYERRKEWIAKLEIDTRQLHERISSPSWRGRSIGFVGDSAICLQVVPKTDQGAYRGEASLSPQHSGFIMKHTVPSEK